MNIFPSDFRLHPNSLVVLGTPSHGNIGQMALDAILSTIYLDQSIGVLNDASLSLVASMTSPHLLPVSGYESFPGVGSILCMPLEVYEYQYGDNRVYFIIQRSRCLVGSSLQYIHDLVQYFKSCSIAGIISLSGASYEFLDINNQSPLSSFFAFAPNYSIPSNLEDLSNNLRSKFPFLSDSLIDANSPYRQGSGMGVVTQFMGESVGISEDGDGKAPLGMMMTMMLWDVASKNEICCMILGRFVNAGENITEAKELAAVVINEMKITSNCQRNGASIFHPMSWQMIYQR